VRVAVEQADDRHAGAEQPRERGRVALAEAGAGLEGAEQQVGARDADDPRPRGPASSRSMPAAWTASGTSAPITAIATSGFACGCSR